jgi:hypothetical protein
VGRQSDDEEESGTESGLVGAPEKEREGREGFVGRAATQCTLVALFVREAAGTLRGRRSGKQQSDAEKVRGDAAAASKKDATIDKKEREGKTRTETF